MSPKIRRIFILIHLWAAGFMAPAFGLHAISGGLYLADIKGDTTVEALTLPAGAALDFKSDTLETDVRALLSEANIDYKFQYIRDRGNVIQLRPTSKTYIQFNQTPDGLTAQQVKPNLVASMMELHKGHGPQLFRTYQKLVAVMLLLVVFGGILVGLMARAYRRQTTIAVIVGSVVFLAVAMII